MDLTYNKFKSGCILDWDHVRISKEYGDVSAIWADIQFQSGPVKECGANGIFIEDLLLIVLKRLADYQMTEFACSENEHAIVNIKKGLDCLQERTRKRTKQGVEGTNVQHVS